jgi:ABC-2 type transport system permease protein
MRLSVIYAVALRDVIRFYRERTQLVGSLSRSVLWLFIMGLGLRGSVNIGGKISYTHYIFPGIIGMTVMFAAVQQAISIVWDREFGFLKEILVAPVSRTSIAMGKAVSGGVISFAQGCLVVVLGLFLGISFNVGGVLEMLLLMALAGVALASLGIVVASRITSFQGFGIIMNFFLMPMFFLSGAMYPVTNLPAWLYVIVRINPLSYMVDGMRGAVLGDQWANFGLAFDALFLLGFFILMIVWAAFSFRAEGRR